MSRRGILRLARSFDAHSDTTSGLPSLSTTFETRSPFTAAVSCANLLLVAPEAGEEGGVSPRAGIDRTSRVSTPLTPRRCRPDFHSLQPHRRDDQTPAWKPW